MNKGLSGFWLLDKPDGITSRKFLDQVSHKLEWKKAGHTGTLDPLATGLMVLVSGEACKLQHIFTGFSKEYIATLYLGASTDTDDREGNIQIMENAPIPTLQQIQSILQTFVGEQQQIPPIHSAIKVNGRRAYKMARKGHEVQMPIRNITIHSLSLLSYQYPLLECKVHCSSGTYIRALARDIGEKLQTKAYLQKLRRTKIGEWDIAKAHTLETITQQDKISLEIALEQYPKIHIFPEQTFAIQNGQRIPWEKLPSQSIPQNKDTPVFIWSQDKIIAFAKYNEKTVSSAKTILSE